MSATEITQRLLMADIGVAAYAGDRVYPGRIPQGAELPNITVSLVSEEQDLVLDGHRDGYESRVTIACHATHYNLANAIGEQVKAALSTVIHHEMDIAEWSDIELWDGEAPFPPVPVVVTAWKTSADLIDHDDARTIFRRIMDYRIRWVSQ